MPTINIQNIGSGATTAGKTMHHTNLQAFATWLKTRNLVANNEVVIAQMYNSETLTTGFSMWTGGFDSSCYCIVEPAPGLSHVDLAPSGALNYSVGGLEIVRSMAGAFGFEHGIMFRKFKFKFTAGGSNYGVVIGRANTSSPNGVYDASLRQCLIMCEANAEAAYGVNTNIASTACNITDNVFFFQGSLGYSLLAREGTYDRNTFVNSGTGAGLTAIRLGATGASKFRDNVFVGCGPKPINRDSFSPGTCVNNFTSEEITGPATGFIVGSVGMINSLTDVRPATGGVLIGAGSVASENTTDIRGGFRGSDPDVGAVMLKAMPLPAKPDTTITSIEIYGQRVTVKGTFTSSVESTSATLSPAEPPNGALRVNGVVTLSGQNFTAVFSNVSPGNYLTPSIIFTNPGGTGTGSGGQSTTVPVPVAPTVKITSQTRSGQSITIAGTFGGIPISASVTLAASSTPNGAVTKGPQSITLNDNGSFVVVLNAITPGSYDAPVVTATNAGGTGSATGETIPRIYANGTQPVGAEPAVILAPYSAPAFTTPSVALNAEVTDVTLVNTSNTAKTNTSFTFAQPFKQGDLAPTNFLLGKTAGKPDVPLQFNVKATHPDGSVRHAIISGLLPSMAANEVRVLSLVRVASSATNTMPTASSAATTAGMSVTASIVVGGITYTASPDSLLAANTPQQTWFGGSIATDWINMVPFKDANGVAHATMTAQFSVRHYPGSGAAKVDVAFEDTHPFNSLTSVTFDASISVNGVVKYAKPALAGVPAGRFKRTVWWGNEPTLHIKHNATYFVGSKQVPNYDLSVVMDESTLSHWGELLATSAFDPFEVGTFTKAMGNTGGRPDIGPLPHFAAGAIISMDKRAKDMTLAHADICGGAWSTHLRDHTTGPGGGRPLSIMYFPYATKAGTDADANNPSTGKSEKLKAPAYGQDVSHQPSIAYLPYLMTGDFFYLEELHFWANYNQYSANCSYRGFHKGTVYHEQIRGQAWCIRTWAHAGAITPDDHPDKAMFAYWLKNNFDYYNAKYTDNPNANIFGFLQESYAIIYPASGDNQAIGLAPWQDDYFTIGVGHASELGFPEATRLLKWKAKFPVGRMLAPGYCYIHAAIYTLNMRATSSSPLYSSFAECLANSIDPVMYAMPCNSQERLDHMNATRSMPSNPYVLNELTGYSNGTTGYPSILQTALAFVSDTDHPDADLAWDLMDSRAVKPNYGTSPQFAVVSRNVESVAATSITLDGPADGLVGEVSGTFTVGTNASRSVSVLVTPISDGGGTFNPASITLAPGAAFATFTYTPTSSGIKQISVTNDGGLSAPSSVIFNAVSLADIVPPQMSGVLSVSNITNTGFTVSWPAASDDVGVDGYEYSLNNATYVNIGRVLARVFTGVTDGGTYTVRLRAYDSYGNRSEPISTTVSTSPYRKVTVRLYQNGSPAANLTGLKWAWSDTPTPDLFDAPTDKGANGTTDSQGYFTTILINSKLQSSEIGWLTVTNSDGAVGTNHKAFSGPVGVV